jgi:hypothetical protein
MKFETLMVIRIHVMVLWVMTLCSDVAGYHVLEDHAASLFRMK